MSAHCDVGMHAARRCLEGLRWSQGACRWCCYPRQIQVEHHAHALKNNSQMNLAFLDAEFSSTEYPAQSLVAVMPPPAPHAMNMLCVMCYLQFGRVHVDGRVASGVQGRGRPRVRWDYQPQVDEICRYAPEPSICTQTIWPSTRLSIISLYAT